MDKLLEIQMSGWTATPRLPFILSGNAICMHTPSYSLILGIIGCCLGRVVLASELQIGFRYSYQTIARDMETRQRLENNNGKIKKHNKGSDAYIREFHTFPKLTIWLNRLDWKEYFENPCGTPSLGRSQDILKIESVTIVDVKGIEKGKVGGTMLPFIPNLQIAGQLVQIAESFIENDEVGMGRTPVASKVFLSVPHDNDSEVIYNNLFMKIHSEPTDSVCFYLHDFENE